MLHSDQPRLLVIPGLHDSGPAHWQSWLQSLHRGALRVRQHDWKTPDLERWATRIASFEANAGGTPFIAVAHSFGCLALVRHLALQPTSGIVAALFVAPADPDKFGVAAQLPQQRLGVPSTLVASSSDPWMSTAQAQRWAQRWGSHFVNLGDAGHVNAESGHGPLPLAARWVNAMLQRQAREQRPERAGFAEWSFAV